MVLPLYSTLANSFLCYHEIIWFKRCPKNLKPKYCKLILDEIFALFENFENLQHFTAYIDKQHINFKLPIKTERNGFLPTLDFKTCRKHGKRFASIYGKDTLYNVYINFSSIQEFRLS